MDEILEYENIDHNGTVKVYSNDNFILIKDNDSSSYLVKNKIASVTVTRTDNVSEKANMFGDYENIVVVIETNISLFAIFVENDTNAEKLMQAIIHEIAKIN